MSPAAMRSPPSQIAATLDTLITSITVGNMNAISRPARSDVSVSASLPSANRSASSGSRTNARTTRMPVICSRSISLMRSMRTCMTWNCGIIREITSPIAMISTGMLTRSSSDSAPSWRTARITPPTIVIGAAMSSVHDISTSIWTWVTSFVMRVINDGAPNAATSWAEKSVTRWNRVLRTSRPNAIATRAPKYTAVIANATCTKVMTSMSPPVFQM